MRRLLRILVALTLLFATLPITLASATSASAASASATSISAASETPAQPVPGTCVQGTLASGALSLICVPSSGWNGDLVLFAHGYVAFNQPLGFYNLTLPDGTYLPTLVQSLGYAFATTSYRENGLAILPAQIDLQELIAAFPSTAGASPHHTYLTGVSEGGIVTALFAERTPNLIDGALAGCGPIGSFQGQIEYFGNFLVLFDYFFPGVIPGSPNGIPSSVIDNWSSVYAPAAAKAMAANPSATAQLIATSGAAIDPSRPLVSSVETALQVLWYDVFATNDANQKLDGNSYGNRAIVYHGSKDDLRLNREVQRYSASPTALTNVVPYETTGNLTIPLVTIHTTDDPVIPFGNELLYRAKAHPTGNGRLTQFPIPAYGHCAFTTAQVLVAFDTLVRQVTGQGLPAYKKT